jgi:hypothetical protein
MRKAQPNDQAIIPQREEDAGIRHIAILARLVMASVLKSISSVSTAQDDSYGVIMPPHSSSFLEDNEAKYGLARPDPLMDNASKRSPTSTRNAL